MLGNGVTAVISLGVLRADAAHVNKKQCLSRKAYSLRYRQQKKARKSVVVIAETGGQGDHRSTLPYELAECTVVHRVLCACPAGTF